MTLHTALYTRVSTDDQNLALEPGDDDPYQRAFLNIMGTIAQLEAAHRLVDGIAAEQGLDASDLLLQANRK